MRAHAALRTVTLSLGMSLFLVIARAAATDNTEERGSRVYVTSSTYWYELPTNVETPYELVEGGLVWHYDGQAVFTDDPAPLEPQTFWYEPTEDRPKTLGEELIGTERVDALGRRWVLVDFDEGTVRARIEAYNAQVLSEYGPEPTSAGPVDAATMEPETAGWVTEWPMAWYHDNCEGSEDVLEIDRWESDGRVRVDSPQMNVRQRKAMLVFAYFGIGGLEYCTGVMVDNDTVLTASHCTHDYNLNHYDTDQFQVCSYGNYQCGTGWCAQCFDVVQIDRSPDWDHQHFEDDYALLHLSGSPGVGWMALSTASDAVILDSAAYNLGYAGWAPGCVDNFIWSEEVTIDDDNFGVYGYGMNHDHTHTPVGLIGTNVDISGGHSGGPIYYYPGGCCGAHYVTGLMSGFHSGFLQPKWTGGPKARDFRDWVIANM